VEPSGELNVGLCYNDHTQRLIVSIVEARNLKAASLDNSSSGLTRYTSGDSDVISSYQLFSAILWGKLCEMFVVLTSVDVTFSIR